MNKISLVCQEGPIRVDKFIANSIDKSRAEVKKYFDESGVFVNGKIAKTSLNINEGDSVEFEIPEVVEAKIEIACANICLVYTSY